MKHIKKMKVDIDKKNFEIIPSVQYDSNTRFLHINLLNGAVPFNLTGCSVKISGTKQDGTAIFNNCTIISEKEGFVEVELTEQMNAVSGTLKCELKIYSANGVLTTKQFSIDITSSVTSKEITSGNEFKALTDALKVVQGIDNKADKEKVEEKFGEVYEQLDTKAQKSQVNIIENRVANIIGNNGNGTKDSEIIDARGNENTIGLRFKNIDGNGYLVNDYIEVGNPRYINSAEVGNGWGVIFAPSSDTIKQIAIRKSKDITVTGEVIIKLVECASANDYEYNNGTLLETVTLTQDEWNNNLVLDQDYLITLTKTHIVNKNKYYAVTVFNAVKINIAQVGYNSSTETESDGYKTTDFKCGLYTTDVSNTIYKNVSYNSYGLYCKVYGEAYRKEILIKERQVEGLTENLNKPIELSKLDFFEDELVTIGQLLETGTKNLLYDNFGKWTTVIKGCDMVADKVTLNKVKESNISNVLYLKLFETDNETGFMTSTPIFEKEISSVDYNNINLGDFDVLFGKEIIFKQNKYYALQLVCESINLGIGKSGTNESNGRVDVTEYFINGYYSLQKSDVWNRIGNIYGIYVKLQDINYKKLAIIKQDQIENFKTDVKDKITDISEKIEVLENIEVNRKERVSYIDVFTDDFSTKESYWTDFNSNWNFNNGLTPTSIGTITTNNIRLAKPYHSDKRIMRCDIVLHSDTILDVVMERYNSNNGEGESVYRIDVPNKKIIMFKSGTNYRGVLIGVESASSDIDFDIIDGNKYLIEVEKNDYTFSFRIKDYLTANISTVQVIGWDAGRQNHYYGFAWIKGNVPPTIKNMKVSMINAPDCVFAGDSITEGVGMSDTDTSSNNNFENRYAEILRKKIGNSMISAMGGDTIGTILSKFDSEYNIIKPKVISVTIGTNGGVTSNSLTQFKTLIDKSYDIDSKLIINLVPCGYSGNYIGVNELLNTLKQDINYKDKFILGCRFDIATAKDYYPIVDEGHPTTINGQNTRVDSSLMTDNTHPNYLGSIRMANRYAIDVPEIFKI